MNSYSVKNFLAFVTKNEVDLFLTNNDLKNNFIILSSETMAKKSGNAAAELTPTEQWRAKKIQEIYRNGSYLQRDLAQALGIHQSQISRYLRGQSAWKHKHLEKLAEIYQVHLRDLLIDKGSVPVLGWISDEGIPYPLIQTPLEGIKPLETAPLPPELNHIKDL